MTSKELKQLKYDIEKYKMHKSIKSIEQENFKESRFGKSLILSLFLAINAFTHISCSNDLNCNIELLNYNDYDRLNDEQVVDMLKKYFNKNEREFIMSHLVECYSSRDLLLGLTISHDCKNPYFTSEMFIYDNNIKKYASEMGLPYEFARGLVVIHELCHVLYYDQSHTTSWLNTFESKIKDYCWDYVDEFSNYYGNGAKFKTADDFVKYIITLQTSDYR